MNLSNEFCQENTSLFVCVIFPYLKINAKYRPNSTDEKEREIWKQKWAHKNIRPCLTILSR